MSTASRQRVSIAGPPRGGTEPVSAVRQTGTARTAGGAGRRKLSLHVDWTACDGHGLCVELLPELLDRDDWGYPIARSGGATRDVRVPAALAPHARRAVRSCPRLALSLPGDRAGR